jgi:hypothetical protein
MWFWFYYKNLFIALKNFLFKHKTQGRFHLFFCELRHPDSDSNRMNTVRICNPGNVHQCQWMDTDLEAAFRVNCLGT